ncbi:MAG: hypothetical protein HYT37_04370 [Candidatus Sungbacteria bacterium]|nr:hypothetical protein [Candidatus Sungbacteria bacterium]
MNITEHKAEKDFSFIALINNIVNAIKHAVVETIALFIFGLISQTIIVALAA